MSICAYPSSVVVPGLEMTRFINLLRDFYCPGEHICTLVLHSLLGWLAAWLVGSAQVLIWWYATLSSTLKGSACDVCMRYARVTALATAATAAAPLRTQQNAMVLVISSNVCKAMQ